MAPSYKPLLQEAQQKIERLDEETAWLKKENERLRAALDASPGDIRRELERTRLIVDLAGIARHMLVDRFTPQQWKQRGHLPPVDFPDISEPLWYVSTLKEKFAIPTRRIWHDNPALADEEDALDARSRRRVKYPA